MTFRPWYPALQSGFLLLCLRSESATVAEAYPNALPTMALIVGGCAFGCYLSQEAAGAFLLAIPLLNGLEQMGLLQCRAVPSLVFSALYTGLFLRALIERRRRQSTEAQIGPRDAVAIISNLLISWLLLSLVISLFRAKGRIHALGQVIFHLHSSFGDPLYFIHSSFLWLQGLFLFDLLRKGDFAGTFRPKAVLAAWALTIAAFFGIQRWLRLPEPYPAFISGSPIYFSPFEDIHSFGSVVLVIFAYIVASIPKIGGRLRPLAWFFSQVPLGSAAVLLFFLVVESWSRAAWLACGLVLLLIALARLKRRWAITFLLAGLISVVAFNTLVTAKTYNGNAYLARLNSLVGFSAVAGRDSGRSFLYHRAFSMIRQRPWAGLGSGLFYLASPKFSTPDDPKASIPDFAHNFVLQLAAESGVPFTLLVITLVILALCRGCGAVRLAYAESNPSDAVLTLAGVTMGLTGYLLTQMTANSLNIYSSNQFLFWMLMAILLARDKAAPQDSHDRDYVAHSVS